MRIIRIYPKVTCLLVVAKHELLCLRSNTLLTASTWWQLMLWIVRLKMKAELLLQHTFTVSVWKRLDSCSLFRQMLRDAVVNCLWSTMGFSFDICHSIKVNLIVTNIAQLLMVSPGDTYWQPLWLVCFHFFKLVGEDQYQQEATRIARLRRAGDLLSRRKRNSQLQK